MTVLLALLAAAVSAYWLWRPGLDVRDGRHDRGSNGIWIAHGWLGGDEWFVRNGKTNQFTKYRARENIVELSARLRRHRITDVFPHLCPVEPTGQLPPVNPVQVERFLDALNGTRVMPWIGGPNGTSARLTDSRWRTAFASSARELLTVHPRFAGVHLNIEPLPSGDRDFLLLLDELRRVLPRGKVLSVAAYPPPTRWHPFPEVHWEENYFREVARRADQMAVMMYDAGQNLGKPYQQLMADWTGEVLAWCEGKPVLLGVPTYDDAGVGYHNPKAENLKNALWGIHRGLTKADTTRGFQGVAIYCEWETGEGEWDLWRQGFLKAGN